MLNFDALESKPIPANATDKTELVIELKIKLLSGVSCLLNTVN